VLTATCPCGSGTPYAGCCGPLHDGARQAGTAAELMRSRYAAYALGELGYVFRTWHPRTRPESIEPEPGLTWTGLTVLAATEDEVEFEAAYERAGVPGRLHERSRFERRRGRWVYVDGELSPAPRRY
jgi:SEC-C motif-containing protein